MRKLTALLVIALLAGSAGAAMSFDFSDEGMLPETDGMGNELAYVAVKVVGDAGEEPNAWDGTVSGPLVQLGVDESDDPFSDSVYSPTDGTPSGWPDDVWPYDSHFMTHKDDMSVVTSPYEDNDWSLGKDPVHDYLDMGLSTELGGIFADTTAAATTWDVLYLVGHPDDTVTLNAEIGAPGVDKWVTGDVDYTFVPEPATMSLLALGGVAALIRRKR